MTGKRGSIVIAAHDGLTGCYAGVGTLLQAEIAVVCRISRRLKRYGIQVSVSAVTPRRDVECYAFDQTIADRTQKLLAATGGSLFEVDDGDPLATWAGPPAWEAAGRAVAGIVGRVTHDGQPTALVSHDVAVAPAAGLAALADAANSHRMVWTPQSTAVNQTEGDRDFDAGRHEFEFEWARETFRSGALIGAASPYAKRHLPEAWCVPQESIVNHFVGIDSQDPSYHPSATRVSHVLRNFGVPLDKPLLVSAGRAVPEKGLDALLRVPFASLAGAARVIIAAPYARPGVVVPSENLQVMQELRRLATDAEMNGASVVLVEQFSAELLRCLLRWPMTRAVVVGSKSEPFGMLALETRHLSASTLPHDGPTLVVSNAEGLSDQVQDRVSGDVVDIWGRFGIAALADRLGELLSRGARRRAEMRSAAASGLEPYRLESSRPELMRRLLPEFSEELSAVRAELAKRTDGGSRPSTATNFPLVAHPQRDATEVSLVLVKSDGIAKGLAPTLARRLRERRLRVTDLGLIALSRLDVLRWGSFIDVLPDREEALAYLSSPSHLLSVEGRGALAACLQLKAEVRSEHATRPLGNLLHVPDDSTAAQRELELFVARRVHAASPSKTLAAVQPCLFPWPGQLALCGAADLFVALDTAQWSRGRFFARNRVRGAWLTLPRSRHSRRARLDTVRVRPADEWLPRWRRTLCTSYGARVPGIHPLEVLDATLRSVPAAWADVPRLTDFTVASTAVLAERMGVGTPVIAASALNVDFMADGDATEKVVELCTLVGAHRYLSGPTARAYLDPQRFAAAGISLEFCSYTSPNYRPGIGEPLSALDLLASRRDAPTLVERYLSAPPRSEKSPSPSDRGPV